MNMDPQKRALLEAALFQASKPLSVEEISKVVEMQENEVDRALEELSAELREGHRGVEILDIGGRYEMRVKGAHVQRVAHLTSHADLSRGLLKVLALIVYKQPITQSDIVKTIGNRGYDYVKDLQERGLVKTEKFRRTKKIELTEQFMSYFGIRSRNELIAQFRGAPKEETPAAVEEKITSVIVDWMAQIDLGKRQDPDETQQNAEKI